MDIKEAILNRRSIRGYSSKKVSLEQVAEILEIARFSPSAGNMQNWKVIVVTDEKVRGKIAAACKGQDWIAEAPVHLVICNEYPDISKIFGKLGKMFSIQDCAILATNIINLAHAEGLGTCWIGSFSAENMKRILDIPEDGVDPEIIITLGYSDDEKIGPSKRKEIFDFSFFDKWDKKDAKFSSKSWIDKINGKLNKLKD